MSVRQAVLFARRRLDSPAGIAAQTRLPLDLVELVLREEGVDSGREDKLLVAELPASKTPACQAVSPIACKGCFFAAACSN